MSLLLKKSTDSPRVIPIGNSLTIMSQGETNINGKLWMAYDNTWIEHFIDPEFITLYGERLFVVQGAIKKNYL